jgi:hypothetical protein
MATGAGLTSALYTILFYGSWTKADFSGGFDLLETEDPKKLIEFAYMWGDLMELDVFPVLEDHELSEALQNAKKKTRSARR